MERHFEKALEVLIGHLGEMVTEVLKSYDAAASGVLDRDPTTSNAVFEIEKNIDALELVLDEKILDFIALHQPVATDLRFVLSLQSAVMDLERIGDHCTNIAQSAISLSMLRQPPDLLAIPEMLPLGRKMIVDAMESFMVRDGAIARRTMALDDRMDEQNRGVAREVIHAVKADRELVETGLELIRISKNLERIGDLSANIAEDALFIVEGKLVRHQPLG